MKRKSSKKLSTKAWIKAEKKKQSRIGLAIFLSLILLIVIPSIYYSYNILSRPNSQTIAHEFKPKAAIVDQLSLTFPNQTFIETATNILKQAGYSVDYYPGEKVTVEFFRNLPIHGYGLIILRVHSAVAEGTTRLALFTSESYSQTKYIYEQLTGQVGIVAFLPYNEGDPLYFGVDYKFLKESMNGQFNNTTIVMMGCEGLTYTTMAEAFIQKGAKVCIGWNASVSVSHTDTATISLLKHLITEKQTINQAVENAMKEAGPDPTYNSQLTYYPLNAREYTIKNLEGT